MRYTKIIFYNNCYDENQLIWKGGKEYLIIGESNDLYICESEPYFKSNQTVESVSYGIEKSIKNMYYLI